MHSHLNIKLSHLICAETWYIRKIVCCLSHTAGQYMWEMFAVQQCLAAICKVYTCHGENAADTFVKKEIPCTNGAV